MIPIVRYNYRLESANSFSSSNTIDHKVFLRLKNHRRAVAVYQKHGIWEMVKYHELQREFITLNNFALRIKSGLRRRLYGEIQHYFADIPVDDAAKFLHKRFRRSFWLIKTGSYPR